MQLTDEAKKAVVNNWSVIVQHLSVLYQLGGVKSIEQSMSLNAPVQFIDQFLKEMLVRDCADCNEKK